MRRMIRSRWRLVAATVSLSAALVTVMTGWAAAPGQALTFPPPKKPSPTPTLRPTPTPTHGCTPTWSPTTFYVPGEQVMYAGHIWLAVFYSTDVVPNLPSSSLYWRDL